MMLALLTHGFVIGFAIAAPVGPIGVLCIQRSLHDGAKVGFITGFGAALADGVYGLIAGFGLTAISTLLVQRQNTIRILGGIFLIYLGLTLFFKKPTTERMTRKKSSAFNAFTTTFLLNLTNPVTILSFIAVFAGLGLASAQTNLQDALILDVGIIAGSAGWWLLLSVGIAYFLRKKLNKKMLEIINKLSAMTLLLFGIVALLMHSH